MKFKTIKIYAQKYMQRKIIVLFLIAIFLSTTGFRCKWVSKSVKKQMRPITLNYWRVWDDEDKFSDIINKYHQIHPYITIKYRKLHYENYEDELINAFAEDKGPDIFSINNSWIRKYKTKITPLPDKIKMVYLVKKGSIKKEVIPELRVKKTMTIRELKDKFADVVFKDVILNDKNKRPRIFALPLHLDTLVMFVNLDLLDNSGVAKIPKTWSEVQAAVKKITKQDNQGNIIQSGIALGTSRNIERYSDILSLLMMQNGATMMEDDIVKFDKIPLIYKDKKYFPGAEALRFYTDFANPAKEVYTWNSKLDDDLDMFISGRLAIFFGYSYHQQIIKQRAPKLNYVIAPMPQIKNNTKQVNFADYWVEVVSKKTKHRNEAWDFIQFATKAENVKSYLKKAKKPTALRSLIDMQKEDDDLAVFANQILTSDDWYYGKDNKAMENIFANMIDSVNQGKEEPLTQIVSLAAKKIQQTVH